MKRAQRGPPRRGITERCPIGAAASMAHADLTNKPLTPRRRLPYQTERAHAGHGYAYACKGAKDNSPHTAGNLTLIPDVSARPLLGHSSRTAGSRSGPSRVPSGYRSFELRTENPPCAEATRRHTRRRVPCGQSRYSRDPLSHDAKPSYGNGVIPGM